MVATRRQTYWISVRLEAQADPVGSYAAGFYLYTTTGSGETCPAACAECVTGAPICVDCYDPAHDPAANCNECADGYSGSPPFCYLCGDGETDGARVVLILIFFFLIFVVQRVWTSVAVRGVGSLLL